MIVQGPSSELSWWRLLTFPIILHAKVLQSIFCLLSDAFNICDGNNAVNSSPANRYVEALTDIICWGTDLRAANLPYATTKVCTEKSVTTTKWTTLATASRIYKTLVKYTSKTVNFSPWVSLFFGRRDGSGMLHGNPIIVLQVTQWLIAFLSSRNPISQTYEIQCGTRTSI